MDDLTRLCEALAPVERAAASLPWARQRPWRTATHVRLDGGVPTVDLHDLGRAAATLAVDRVLDRAEGLEAGAVCFVVGRGRRSVGPPVLPAVVEARLRERCAGSGWRIRRPRAGRYAVIVDPRRAPPAATGALGWGFWLWLAFVAAAALAAAWGAWIKG